VVREEDNKMRSTIVIMSSENSSQDEKSPFDDADRQELDCLEVPTRVIRANNLLGIIDGSVKRPMIIMESDTNQKDIDNWNALDGWAMAILSTSVEPAFIEEHVMATSSYDL